MSLQPFLGTPNHGGRVLWPERQQDERNDDQGELDNGKEEYRHDPRVGGRLVAHQKMRCGEVDRTGKAEYRTNHDGQPKTGLAQGPLHPVALVRRTAIRRWFWLPAEAAGDQQHPHCEQEEPESQVGCQAQRTLGPDEVGLDDQDIHEADQHGHAYAPEQDTPKHGARPPIHQHCQVDGKQARVTQAVDADVIADTGLFGDPVCRTDTQRITRSADVVIGVENTRATSLSWPGDVRREFTEELRRYLGPQAKAHLTLQTTVTMAPVLRPGDHALVSRRAACRTRGQSRSADG